MENPHIRFIASAKRDRETAKAFFKEAKFDSGRNLEWSVFKKYPELKKYYRNEDNHFNRQKIYHFVNGAYHKSRRTMANDLKQNKLIWKKKEIGFYRLVSDLFENKTWPSGKYIAYGTIWGMYPRFLDTKTFQIPYRHKRANYIPVIIAHEMLHFMFYDYFYKRFPKYLNQEKYSFFNWHVSEIFNSIVQNSKGWTRFFGAKSMAYPEHKKIISKIFNEFSDKTITNIDFLTDEIIKFVKTGLKW